jgi:hypothetical protein
MKKLKTILLLLPLFIAYSCVNLKAVNVVSSASVQSLEKFDDIHFTRKSLCIDRCYDSLIQKNSLLDSDHLPGCDCSLEESADKTVKIMYMAVLSYMQSLKKLSGLDLSEYNLDPITNALTEKEYPGLSIDKATVTAYGKLASTIRNALTGTYARRKIKNAVRDANEPLQVLLSKLDIAMVWLTATLDSRKIALHTTYTGLVMDSLSSKYDKSKALAEYYARIKELDNRMDQLRIFHLSLMKISQAHQQLYDNRNKITKKDFAGLIREYAGQLQTLINEFNKIKN